jgi:hypothetical protein
MILWLDLQRIYLIFAAGIDVDRFVLLATTGKNAKNKLLVLLPSGNLFFSLSIHYMFYIYNYHIIKVSNELFIHLRIRVRRAPR